ncbi:MAG TPA: hypothetical protein VGB83_04140 [Actinomycetota bacterium]
MRTLAIAAGAFVCLATMSSVISTVILPRGVRVRTRRVVFLLWRLACRARARNASFDRADRIMAKLAPVGLILLLATWLLLVMLGFLLIFWGLGASWRVALVSSGSSLTTLGFSLPAGTPSTVAAVAEAAIGLIIVATLIAYLPSLYTVFSKREAMVAALEVRADSPPSAVVMLKRLYLIGYLDRLPALFTEWERWFIELEESHSSFPFLSFFRSPVPMQSWLTAAGAVLDAASLSASVLDRPPNAEQQLCIRAGYVALRRIASGFMIPFDPDPQPGDPICLTREDFDRACDELEGVGVPLKADRDQAWRDFAGWRVNYDRVLVGIAAFVMAPPAEWSTNLIPRFGRDVPRPVSLLSRRRYQRSLRKGTPLLPIEQPDGVRGNAL